jgi:hypothetical protein
MPLVSRAVAAEAAGPAKEKAGRAESAVNTWRLSIIRSSMAGKMGDG